MAHTNAWNTTDPPGSEQAKNIDDHIRKVRLDVGERLSDIVTDIMADPLVLKPQYSGAVDGKQIVIPFSSFNSSIIGKEVTYGHGCLTAFSDSHVVLAPIILPPGTTIKKVELLCDAGDTAGLTWYLYSRNFGGGGSRPSSQSSHTTLVTTSVSGVGVQISATSDLTFVVDAATMYYIAVDGLGPNGLSYDIFGARVTYNTPSAQKTI